MIKTTLKIDGMMCGMCESHMNDVIRKNFKIKKVTSSARDGETVIISEEPIDIPWAKKVIHEIGYEMTGSSNEPYEKKGLFRFGKKYGGFLPRKRQSKFFGEFKKFILRGNVMDMAVGVIVGGAFTSIVTSLNADILTPILGIFGGTDFSYLTVTLGTGENAPVLHYGNFITAVINFLITALVIFIMLKVINRITEKLSTLAGMEEEKPEPTTKKCPFCYSEIDIRATRCPHCTSVLDEQE